MNNRRHITLLLFLFTQVSALQAFDIKKMFEGMGTAFGAPPVGYTYSFEVWNDANIPMYVELQDIASFMGAFFPSAKGYFGKKKLQSIFDAAGSVSKVEYHNQGYYFDFFISSNSDTPHAHSIYKQYLHQLPLEKRDPKIFYYHVYTARDFAHGNMTHVPAVEVMGFQDPTPNAKIKGSVVLSSQLSALSFYNSSGTDVQVTLTYNKQPYTCTLEKYSYNLLTVPASKDKKSASNSAETQDKNPESQFAFSLRPNSLTFASYDASSQKYTPFKTLMLPAQGFDGYTYVLEVYQDLGKNLEVGIQGLNPGNYTVPVAPRVRDLNPCSCTFWHQSFEQGGSIEGYGDLQGQVWVVYAGADSSVMTKVVPGQAFAWNLIRPLLRQADQFVYFIYVLTLDDAVAQKFIEKVLTKNVGKNVIDEYRKTMNTPIPAASQENVDDVADDGQPAAQLTLTSEQQVAAVMGSLHIDTGVIEDTEQGIIGYLLGADVFTSRGLGSGSYYYVLSPSVVSVDNLVALVFECLDTSRMSKEGTSDDALKAAVKATVHSWLAAYLKKPADVQQQVEQYLVGYGNAKLVNAQTGTLTKYGQAQLHSIVAGPVSIKYPSMKLSTVANHFVYDFGKSAPDKMPKPVTKAQLATA